ncbi:ATP-binding protein [Catenovulum agarivorans]|uniref:ATP-binding protein n=1 Tax=Catenovulum agarivorans TaxID=1172192 RepID=UPI00030A0CC8|nr:ATP-binding protein [Catenovulum agarivorans]
MPLTNDTKAVSTSLILATVLLVLIGIFVTAVYYFEKVIHTSVAQEINSKLESNLNKVDNQLKSFIKQNISYLQFLSGTPPMQGLIRAEANDGIDPKDSTPTEEWKLRFATIFESLVFTYPQILQVRVIDAHTGMEQVRVERSFSRVNIVPAGKLQNKADRGYVTEVIELGEKQVYVSPINLNKEQGRISYPLQPTIRFATPIYADSGELAKVLVLNVDANELYQQWLEALDENNKIIVMDSDNNFIFHPNPELSFSLDRELQRKLDSEYQVKSWLIKGVQLAKFNQDSHQVLLKRKDIIMLNSQQINVLVKVPYSSYTELLNQRRYSTYGLIGIVSAIFLAILILTWLYYRNRQALSETKAEFGAIVNGAMDAIIGLNSQLQVTKYNASAVKIFPELFSHNTDHYALLPSFFPHDEIVKRQTLFEQGQTQSIADNSFEFKNTQNDHFLVSVSPVRSETASLIGLSLIVRDITKQKLAEAEISKINRSLEKQVDERTQQLQKAHKLALQSSEVKSAFISTISHEMRTPLNGILGMMDLVRREALSDKQQKYIDMMEQSSTTLAALINDVLDLSKIEAGKLDINQQPFNPISTIEHTINSIAIKAQEKALDCHLDLLGLDFFQLVGDASRIKQILYNLVSNAIKFTESGGVFISANTWVEHKQVWLEIKVKDTGKGISAENHNKLFQSFSQENASISSEYGGTGLGLSITKQLCELMGGSVFFKSQLGKGSLFGFKLPFDLDKSKQLDNTETFAGKTFSLLLASEYEMRYWERLIAKFAGQTVKENPDFYVIDLNNPSCNKIVSSSEFEKAIVLVNPYSRFDIGKHCYACINKPLKLGDILDVVNKGASQALGYKQNTKALAKQNRNLKYAGLSGKTIFVVDDNEINIEVAKGIIETQETMVLTAYNGLNLLEELKSLSDSDIRISAILMDCNMPIMDGYQAAKEIRKGSAGIKYLETPIIAMTANAMSGEREKCLAAGMSDYISKPVDPDNLFSILSKYLINDEPRKSTEQVQLTQMNKPNSDQKVISLKKDKQVLNTKEAMSRLLNDTNLYIKICEIFLSQSADKVEQLLEAIKQGESTQVQKLSHALKGQCGDLGGDLLREVFIQTENKAKAEDIEGYQKLLPELENRYDELLTVIQTEVKKLAAS